MNANKSEVCLTVERVVALALALVLLRSGSAHTGNSYYFLSTIYSYQIVGMKTGLILAATLPYLQFTLASCLLCRWWLRGAYLVSTMLFVTFVVAQALALKRGLDISCGCFGAGESLNIGAATLSVAGGCTVISLLGYYLSYFKQGSGDKTCVNQSAVASP